MLEVKKEVKREVYVIGLETFILEIVTYMCVFYVSDSQPDSFLLLDPIWALY